jgi:hypothetical protein
VFHDGPVNALVGKLASGVFELQQPVQQGGGQALPELLFQGKYLHPELLRVNPVAERVAQRIQGSALSNGQSRQPALQ